MRARIAAILIPVLVSSVQAQAQTPSARASLRSSELARVFSKSKHVVKEKRGLRREKFIEVKSAPSPRANLSGYSGTYLADFGFVLHLTVRQDGRVDGSGEDPVATDSRISRSFVLMNSRIDGTLLQGSKVYADGHVEKLEGVFMNRTTRQSPTDTGATTFGLGVLIQPRPMSGIVVERLFYVPGDR